MDGGLRVEERDGSAVLFPFDSPPRRLAASPAPVVGGGEGVRVAARSVLYFPMAPVRPGDPLFWLIKEGGEPRPVGRARPGQTAILGQLENSGWAAPAGGDIYFAPALRPELLRFDAGGELLWRAFWKPERDLEQARLQVVDGVLRPDFSVLQYGISRGPDGRVYLLAASREDRRPDRLLVFDHDGVLIREGRVDPGAAVYADAQGRVFVMSLDEALSRTPEAERAAFRGFELASLYEAEDSVRLGDYAGRVVVVNFWASWCPPCRREIPLLEELSRELDPGEAVVIGLNEDVRPADGRAFLEEVGGVSYPNGTGGGRLRTSYGYRGLPYTVVLDREHRIARSFYGFGSSLDPIREAVLEELGRTRSASPLRYDSRLPLEREPSTL